MPYHTFAENRVHLSRGILGSYNDIGFDFYFVNKNDVELYN
jgi:hypothetical protein